MPTLEQATKPPANLAQMVEVLQPQNPPAPVLVPREQPGLAVGSLGPAPDTFTTAYDRIRQWFRPGTSQQRFPPLPSKVNPSLNASSASVSRTVSTEVVNSLAPDDDTPIVNLQTGTNYTVVPGDLNKLISISNAAGGIIYLPPVAGTTNVAVNNNVVTPFTAGNSVNTGPNTVTSTYTFTPTVDINAGDYIMWSGRRVMSPNETASIGVSDSQNGSWTVRSTNQNNPGVGAENNAIGYVQNLTKIPAGNSITITLVANFSTTSLFNPDRNGLWSVSGLKGLDQEAIAQTASAGTPYSSGGLTLQQNCFLISSQNSNLGDINPAVPANTQGLAWTSLVGGVAPASFAASYILIAGPGAVNDVYTTTSTTARIDRLTSFSVATLGEILRLKDNFFCYVENKGAGTFQLHSTALIDGSQNNVTLASGQGCLLVYDSTSGGWYTMRGIGGAATIFYQTVEQAGTAKPQELNLNFLSPMTATDNAGNSSTDIAVSVFVASGASHATGLVPDPGASAGTTHFLREDATWVVPSAAGTAGGDLSGTYPNPSVVKVNGAAIPTSAAFVATNGSNQFVAAAYTPENVANKDAASGYAGLDSTTHLKVAEQQETVDARTSTSEAITDSDRGKVVTFSNTSAVAATIAQAGASSLFIAGWWCDIVNLNTGIVTLTPTTSTINGAATLVLVKGEGGRLLSDGSNYIFVAGQPTIDTPNDADVLTFEAATERWRSKPISALGGANASQLRGNNISSATPQDQDVLKWSATDNQYDLVLADGMEHGDSVWWTDPGFFVMKDDFISMMNVVVTPANTLTGIGELGWCLFGTSSPTSSGQNGGGPPHAGTFYWPNNTGSANYSALFLQSKFAITPPFWQPRSFALLENPGWHLSWVFKFSGDITTSGNNTATFTKKSLYVGLSGSAVLAVAATTAGANSARPDTFIGLRYDTTVTPGALTLSAAGNASGGNTTYTGTITGGANGAFIGISFTVTGFTNAANNGTFTCVASTTTSLVLANASGVAETHAGTATGSGGINDSTFHFEVISNPQYANAARHNKTGTSVDTTITPGFGNWYRLDMVCTTAGQVIMTLYDENNAVNATHTFTVSQNSVTLPSFTFTTNGVGTARFGPTISGSSTATPPTFRCPELAAGSQVTFSGFTTVTYMNATWTVESVSDRSGAATELDWWITGTGHNNASQASQTPTMVYYPALTPCFVWGDDDGTQDTNANSVQVDFFALGWNKAIASPSTSPNSAKSRYW